MKEQECLEVLEDAILKARFLAQKCRTDRSPRDILDEIWDLMDSVHNIPASLSHPEQWSQESVMNDFDGYKKRWQAKGKIPLSPPSQRTSEAKKNSQVTGNVGLYFVCYHLSILGWNAMPTSRNAKGIDILAYNGDCTRTISLQVKTLSKRAPVPLGTSIDKLLGDYWVIVNNVEGTFGIFVMQPKEVHDRAHRGEKDGKISYWLQPKTYELDEFRDKWDRIGKP